MIEEAGAGMPMLAELIDAVGGEDFYPLLQRALGEVARFQNFIVISFEPSRAVSIRHTNLPRAGLEAQMEGFVAGLYLLDPFYVASTNGDERPFVTLTEVAPEAFTETEFFREHYIYVHVADEARFVVPLGQDGWVHVFVEREPPQAPFGAAEIDRLGRQARLVGALVRKHHQWTAGTGTPGTNPPRADIRSVIARMPGPHITRREVETIELLLQGHGSRSIAARLGISEGTVTNHKRHIYEKLGIHSQAQLFSLFLSALYGKAED